MVCFRMEEITLSEESPDDIVNETDKNNGSYFEGIPKYVYLSVILLFKIFAFTHHINQNNLSEQSNASDNKPPVSATVDTPTNETVDTPDNQTEDTPDNQTEDTPDNQTEDTLSFESIHAWFYSHDGVGHIIFDVAIYLLFVILFVIIVCKLLYSLLNEIKWSARLIKWLARQIKWFANKFKR